MYPVERREALLKLLTKKGFVSISELAIQLNVSEITIRRDLKFLQREGLVERVIGGGQARKSAMEPTFMNKRILQQSEKAAIAKQALTLIEDGMTIGLSAGTTTWTLAQCIRKSTPAPFTQKDPDMYFSNLTFVTNSTNVAVALQASGWTDIHLTGGQFRTPSDALVGPLAEATASKLHTDLLFLGVHGVDVAYGASSPNLQEVAVNRALMQGSESVVLLFDHTKWGIRALAQMAAFDEVDVAVTDIGEDGAGSEDVSELRNLGVEVLAVGTAMSGGRSVGMREN